MNEQSVDYSTYSLFFMRVFWIVAPSCSWALVARMKRFFLHFINECDWKSFQPLFSLPSAHSWHRIENGSSIDISISATVHECNNNKNLSFDYNKLCNMTGLSMTFAAKLIGKHNFLSHINNKLHQWFWRIFKDYCEKKQPRRIFWNIDILPGTFLQHAFCFQVRHDSMGFYELVRMYCAIHSNIFIEALGRLTT